MYEGCKKGFMNEGYKKGGIYPYIAVVGAMLIWSASGIAVKAALVAFSPLTLIVLRFTGAVVLMALLGLLFRKSPLLGLQKIEKGDWWLFVLGGFFQPILYFILETYTYRALASPTIAETFLSTNPLIAPIFAWLILRERVTRNNIWGILVSTAGMLLLVLAGAENFEIGDVWGIPLALVTVCAAAGYSIVLKKIPERYSPLSIVLYVQLIGLCFFYPLWFVMDGDWSLVVGRWSLVDNLSSLVGVGYLAVLSSVVAFILFCYSVRCIGVTQANIFNNIRPVFTAVMMLLFFGEQLPLVKWVGIAMVIVGLFVSQKRQN
ncbi:MAG: EamA family transporter [Paludibacteraceae bacterium]|nr:EamA family transporter [Paludibacteraceae bacterium]